MARHENCETHAVDVRARQYKNALKLHKSAQ